MSGTNDLVESRTIKVQVIEETKYTSGRVRVEAKGNFEVICDSIAESNFVLNSYLNLGIRLNDAETQQAGETVIDPLK